MNIEDCLYWHFFEHFYLTSLLALDVHFAPQAYSCPFCALDFDIIGDLDNFENDLKFVAGELNFTVSSNAS